MRLSSLKTSRVTVVDPSSGRVVTTIPATNVYELGFSPLGTYIITWQRSTKDEDGNAVKNLKVWRTMDASAGAEGERDVVGKFVQKSQTGWNLQYTSDEKFCARVVTNEIQFYQSGDLGTVWNKLRVEGVTDFAVSPGEAHAVAVFVPERKASTVGKRQSRPGADMSSTGDAGYREAVQGAAIRDCRVAKDVLQGRQGPIQME